MGKHTKLEMLREKNIKQEILKKSWGYFVQLYVKSFENLDEKLIHIWKNSLPNIGPNGHIKNLHL